MSDIVANGIRNAVEAMRQGRIWDAHAFCEAARQSALDSGDKALLQETILQIMTMLFSFRRKSRVVEYYNQLAVDYGATLESELPSVHFTSNDVIRDVYVNARMKTRVRLGICQLTPPLMISDSKIPSFDGRQETSHVQKIEHALQIAGEHEVDIVTFPELTIAFHALRATDADLNDCSACGLMRSFSEHFNAVVVGGTYYRQGPTGWLAEAPIFHPNRDPFITTKQIPSRFEPFLNADGHINIVHTHVGSIAVFVCYDFLAPKVHASLFSKDIDIAVIAACSPVVKDFHVLADLLARRKTGGIFPVLVNVASDPFTMSTDSSYGNSGIFADTHSEWMPDAIEFGPAFTKSSSTNLFSIPPSKQQIVIAELDLLNKRVSRRTTFTEGTYGNVTAGGTFDL